MKAKKIILNALSIFACMIALPVIGYSQPAPPPGSGGSGTSPDTPLSVPFDADMNFMFAAIAVVFAVVMIKKLQKKKAIA